MTERQVEGMFDFLGCMMAKVAANDGVKPDWLTQELSELWWGLDAEVRDELRLDIDSYIITLRAGDREEMRKSLQRAIGECHDVANYAFMIADKCRVLLEAD